ncbi:MAG: cellulose biosynthesis protein BcsQ [Rhodoferax sp.]
MSVIGIVSMKGGVGKTSVTANLAAAVARALGPGRVSAIDLDPQNALHWHFGVDGRHQAGVAQQAIHGGNWARAAQTSAHDVCCLPYGEVSEPEREAFEELMAREPDLLGHAIHEARLDQDAVVFIDTPPGPSPYLKQVFQCADVIVMVILADAGSYATIPAMEEWVADMGAHNPRLISFYLVNQVDRSEILSRDVHDLLMHRLQGRIAPLGIHADETVREALAFQQPVMAYDPHGQASHDLARLANWLLDTLSP